jgi:vacuolar-type H+-ATPase subunit D/Vma8
MEENFKLILNELQKINTRLENLEEGQKHLEEGQSKLHLDVIEVKDGQERLQKNLIQSLGDYTEKMIQYTDDKTSALNKRIYRVETEIEKLIRQ